MRFRGDRRPLPHTFVKASLHPVPGLFVFGRLLLQLDGARLLFPLGGDLDGLPIFAACFVLILR